MKPDEDDDDDEDDGSDMTTVGEDGEEEGFLGADEEGAGEAVTPRFSPRMSMGAPKIRAPKMEAPKIGAPQLKKPKMLTAEGKAKRDLKRAVKRAKWVEKQRLKVRKALGDVT